MKISNRDCPIKLVIEVTPYVSVLLAYACFIIPCIIGQKKEIVDIAIIDNYNSLSQTPKMMGINLVRVIDNGDDDNSQKPILNGDDDDSHKPILTGWG